MKLRKNDAAIVFTKKHGCYLHLPKIDPVPDHAMTAAALVHLLGAGDKNLLRIIRRQIAEFKRIIREGKG